MTAKQSRAAEMFKVLSVESRLRILELLRGRALCVNYLAARLEMTPGAVSQHLRVMRAAGLVSGEKRGYFVHYRLNGKTLARWREEINRLLRPGEPGPAAHAKEGGETCALKKRARPAGSRKS